MEFKTDGQQHIRLVYVDVSHKGETLNFSMKSFNRTTFFNTIKILDNTNQFVSYLDMETQDKLFDIYKKAKTAFEDIKDSERLHKKLIGLVENLFLIVSFEDMRNFYSKYIRVPVYQDLKEVYGVDDNELTKELTYLKSDYYELVILSALLKLTIPIFGEYLEIVDKEVGSKFKEYKVYSLLTNSNIINLTAFKRLQTYVMASIEKEKRKNQSNLRTNSSILSGLGTQELPGWLMSKALIRKLMLHEELSDNSAIASIYHSIEQHISSLDKSFGGTVRDKKAPFKDTDGDKSSYAENYKIKQTISDGDLALLSAYMEELNSIVFKVEPNVDPYLLNICKENINRNGHMPIHQHQVTLAQWVLSSAISPKGIPALKKSAMLNAIAGTQAILWTWGFKELSLLMTCNVYYGEESFDGGLTRIDNKLLQVLNNLYPHHQIKNKNQSVRNSNPAVITINKLSSKIITSDWLSHSPAMLEQDYGIDPNNKVIYSSPDVSIYLSNLIIKLNETDLEYRR